MTRGRSVMSTTRDVGVRLVRMTDEHLEATRRWLLDPQLRRQLDSLGAPDEGHASYWQTRWADPTEEVYAIVNADGAHVGNCGLRDIDSRRRRSELWVYLGNHRGSGLGTASVQALLKRAFDELGLHRVYLRVRSDNPRAERFYRRLGFVLEGRWREDTWDGDTAIDSLWFSMLHTDQQGLESLRAEVERAAGHYYHTPLQRGIDNRTKRFIIDRCVPHVRGPGVLELGYVDGAWTDVLVERTLQVDIVEGATRHVHHARERYAGQTGVRVFHCLFQEFTPDRRYATVLAADIIRYLPDPVSFLANARNWLAPDGRLIVTVPNGRSLHRRIGALAGMQATPDSSNERDAEVGNRRGYDRYELRHLLANAGYSVDVLHGCFLKPLSSAQMQDWSDDLLSAFRDVGDELEDYAWFLYAVSTPGQ